MAEKNNDGFSTAVLVGIVAIVGIVGLVSLINTNTATPTKTSTSYELQFLDEQGNIIGDPVSRSYCRKRSDCWWDRSAGGCRCEGKSADSKTTEQIDDYTYTIR